MIRRILCWLGQHRGWRIDKRYTNTAYSVRCVDCGRREVMNDDLQACVPWDPSFDEFYDELARFSGETSAVEK